MSLDLASNASHRVHRMKTTLVAPGTRLGLMMPVLAEAIR